MNAVCWQTIWPDLLKGAPAAIVALVIGLFAAGIALRQYNVAKGKLKLDLFERRLEIYQGVFALLWETMPGRPDGPNEPISSQDIYDRATFLFGDDVNRYCLQVQSVCKKLSALNTLTYAAYTGTNNAEENKRELLVLREWVGRQIDGECREMFAPYLAFGGWK